MSAVTVLQDLASRPFVRKLTDYFVGRHARWRVAQRQRRPVERVQEQTLLKLVRHARDTQFGHAHGFASVRSVADFQRQVPLTDYETLWDRYWKGPFPFLQGVTWPD